MNYREKISRQVILLVLVLFGLTMTFSGDSFGESKKFAYWANNTFDDLLDYFKGLYLSGADVDFVQQVIMYIVSRVTNAPSVYFGVIAAIFAFFYLSSLEHIYDQHNLNGNQNALIHFWFFVMVLPISYISGSRWALAAWVFFFAVYHFFVEGKRSYIFLTGISVFIHFSFLGPFLIFLGFIGLGKRNSIYYFLVVLSFILQLSASSYLSQIDTNSFSGIQERVSLYNNEDEIEFRQEVYQEVAWYVKYPRTMVWIYLALGLYFTRKKLRSVSKEALLEKLYSFCLLLFALANSFLKIPSGGRFQTIFFMFATVYLIILLAKARPKGLSIITIIGSVPMLLFFVVELRRCFDLLNIALAAPLPVSFLTNINLFNIQ